MYKKYADLLTRVGANVHPGDQVAINADVNNAFFARLVQESAYQAGATRVTILWRDELASKTKYTYETAETLADIPAWVAESRNTIADNHIAYICILSDDPDIYADVDPAKLIASSRANRNACKRFYDASMINDIRWCLAAMPTPAWAKRVCPGMDEAAAMDALWNKIATAMRLDSEDPVQAWKDHLEEMASNASKLNSMDLVELHFTNSIGTDLVIGLPENYHFVSAGEEATDGYSFIANMPTEEVFSAPHCFKVNGKVVASMPLIHNGSLIDNFGMTFKDGKVVDYYAETGYDNLKGIIDTDEGAARLGEVALVPYNSPISNMNTLFYNTLFDENASCHLALGRAYASCVKGGETMNEDEKKAAGINSSAEHVDFMIGTKDLSIVGKDKSGKEIQIFVDGNFAI